MARVTFLDFFSVSGETSVSGRKKGESFEVSHRTLVSSERQRRRNETDVKAMQFILQ